jgi:hypothetical protein
MNYEKIKGWCRIGEEMAFGQKIAKIHKWGVGRQWSCRKGILF